MRRLGALSRGGVTSVPGFRSWEYLRASLLWRRSPRSWTPTQPSISQLYLCPYLCFFFFVFLFFFLRFVGEKQTRLDRWIAEIDSRFLRSNGVCCTGKGRIWDVWGDSKRKIGLDEVRGSLAFEIFGNFELWFHARDWNSNFLRVICFQFKKFCCFLIRRRIKRV